MKKLTNNEIDFIKHTGWTPTLHQMNYSESELKRTHLYQVQNISVSSEMMKLEFASFANQYGFNLSDLYKKTCDVEHADAISLEEEATYLFYTFFTKDELEEIDNYWALNWLKDFKYYFGFRKWCEQDVENSVLDALEVYSGKREFFETSDGEIWSRLYEKK